jgi:hypothetical protein
VAGKNYTPMKNPLQNIVLSGLIITLNSLNSKFFAIEGFPSQGNLPTLQ